MVSEREAFLARCRSVAEAARACGAHLRTKAEARAVVVDVRGTSLEFPLADDEPGGLAPSVDEAFYVAMLDANAYAAVRSEERQPADGARRREDRDDPAERVRALARLLGGVETMRRVLGAGGLRAGA